MGSIRAKIEAANDISTEMVEIPEWDVTVEVRGLSLGERNKIVVQSRKGDGTTDVEEFFPRLVIASTFDPEDGSRVFGWDEIGFLKSKNPLAIDRIAKITMRLSGLGNKADEIAPAEAVEAAGKDYSSTENEERSSSLQSV